MVKRPCAKSLIESVPRYPSAMIALRPSTVSPLTPAQQPSGPKGSYIIKLKDGKDGAEAKKLLDEIKKQGMLSSRFLQYSPV